MKIVKVDKIKHKIKKENEKFIILIFNIFYQTLVLKVIYTLQQPPRGSLCLISSVDIVVFGKFEQNTSRYRNITWEKWIVRSTPHSKQPYSPLFCRKINE